MDGIPNFVFIALAALLWGGVEVLRAYRDKLIAKKVAEVKTTLTEKDTKTEQSFAEADKKLDHITVLTNSTLTAANKRIDQLEKAIRVLIEERKPSSGLDKQPGDDALKDLDLPHDKA